MKQLFYLTVAIILFASCERDANIDFPDVAVQHVVNAFLSPDQEEIKVTVSLTNPYIKEQANPTSTVENAKVTINGIEIPFKENDSLDERTSIFTLDASKLNIVPGQTYSIMVSSDKAETVTATTTVPVGKVTKYEVGDIKQNRNEYEISFSFTDVDLTKENFYDFNAYRKEKVNGVEYTNKILNENAIYSDITFSDNQKVIREINFSNYSDNREKSLLFIVSHVDENYYKYFNTVNIDNENPLSEPTPIFSNIENGVGVFGSYVATFIEEPLP